MRQNKEIHALLGLLLLGLSALGRADVQADAPVAGLRPYQRPERAPVLQRPQLSPARQAMALAGIAEPRTGLGFLKDQGAWYTPFNRPNMPGRYDLRGLHADPLQKKD